MCFEEKAEDENADGNSRLSLFYSMGVELLASRKQLDVAGSVTDFYLFL